MAKNRGKEHTTLTETAQEVVAVLKLFKEAKMIAPGIISQGGKGRSGNRFVTIVRTTAGFELIITGQGVQKVAVHADKQETENLIQALRTSKRLQKFTFKERERKPGI